MNPKAKIIIPNILTSIRLIAAPFIIIFAILKLYLPAFIILIAACITDFLDGMLARKWNTVTIFGAKLDAVSDKVLSISMIMFLTIKYKLFAILLILECVIGILNMISYIKTKNVKSLFIGKIKTTIVFFTMILGFLYFVNKGINNILVGFIYVSINMQILTSISYIIYFYDNYKNEEIEESLEKDKDKRRTQIFDIEEYDDIKEFTDDTIKIDKIDEI